MSFRLFLIFFLSVILSLPYTRTAQQAKYTKGNIWEDLEYAKGYETENQKQNAVGILKATEVANAAKEESENPFASLESVLMAVRNARDKIRREKKGGLAAAEDVVNAVEKTADRIKMKRARQAGAQREKSLNSLDMQAVAAAAKEEASQVVHCLKNAKLVYPPRRFILEVINFTYTCTRNTHTHTHARTHTHTHMHKHIHAHTHTRTHTCTHVLTYIPYGIYRICHYLLLFTLTCILRIHRNTTSSYNNRAGIFDFLLLRLSLSSISRFFL